MDKSTTFDDIERSKMAMPAKPFKDFLAQRLGIPVVSDAEASKLFQELTKCSVVVDKRRSWNRNKIYYPLFRAFLREAFGMPAEVWHRCVARVAPSLTAALPAAAQEGDYRVVFSYTVAPKEVAPKKLVRSRAAAAPCRVPTGGVLCRATRRTDWRRRPATR
jgi:hypothetical protein